VRDADGRDTKDGAEMQREACPAWVIAACRVDEEHLGELRKSADGRLEQRPLAQGEESRHVGRAGLAFRDRTENVLAVAHERRPRPARITLGAGADLAPGEAHEAPTRHSHPDRPPWFGAHDRERELLRDEFDCRAGARGQRSHTAPVPSPGEGLVAAALATGVRDARVLEALRIVRRAAFVPAELADRAGIDEPLPIPHGQVTTQPSLVAKMVEALALTGSERVLEIGTGFGFQTAVLARLAAHVFSVERHGDLAETAQKNLAREGVRNVDVIVGDGTYGLADRAPFHAILVSAAFPRVPPPLAEQLVEGGRLVQPIGSGGSEEVILFERVGAELVARRSVTGACFVPLVGRHGFQA
jgi:protein-L-isoaspartate(D-aspartate) O-methyltransferase